MAPPPEIHIPEEFESERLTIRAPRVEDAFELNAAVRESLDSLRPWMPWAQAAPSLEETQENLRIAREKFLAREDFRLNFFRKGTGALVGCGGLHRAEWSVPKLEIGYWVRTSFARQGYITEAVHCITDFAFDHFQARRVEIRMDSRNERSWRVAERAGFELEGILRNERRHVDGSLGDTRVYAKVRGDHK